MKNINSIVKQEVDNSRSKQLIDIEVIDDLIEETENIIKSIFGEANNVAQIFWSAHDTKRVITKHTNYKFLGLRIKPTIINGNWFGSFSIIWTNSRCTKEKGQWVQRSEQIKRGKKPIYSMNSFKKALPWEYQHVEELEPIFSKIRTASAAVSKSRTALIHAKKCLTLLKLTLEKADIR